MKKTTPRNSGMIRIANDGQQTLSAAQKQFNTLIKKIDSKKKLLREWQDTISYCQQRSGGEYQVLQDSFLRHKLEFACLLDQHHERSKFTKAEKSKIQHIILDVCESLIEDGLDADEIKVLFNRYSDEDYDTAMQERSDDVNFLLKDFVKNIFNVEVDDDVDVSSPERLHAHVREKLEQQQAESVESKPPPRKKTKQQLAREQRQQEEEALANKSVQEVYRKLVAELHPDREPDEQERKRKTALMQRVNGAYDKKDLLQLLELQLEIEQIDPARLGAMADSRLKHFNKVLKEQLDEIDDNIFAIRQMVQGMMGYQAIGNFTPKKLMTTLDNDIKQMQRDIDSIRADIGYFQSAVAFKAWLKSYRIPKQRQYDDFDDLLDMIAPIMKR